MGTCQQYEVRRLPRGQWGQPELLADARYKSLFSALEVGGISICFLKLSLISRIYQAGLFKR